MNHNVSSVRCPQSSAFIFRFIFDNYKATQEPPLIVGFPAVNRAQCADGVSDSVTWKGVIDNGIMRFVELVKHLV